MLWPRLLLLRLAIASGHSVGVRVPRCVGAFSALAALATARRPLWRGDRGAGAAGGSGSSGVAEQGRSVVVAAMRGTVGRSDGDHGEAERRAIADGTDDGRQWRSAQ